MRVSERCEMNGRSQIGELGGSLKPAPPAVKASAAENQYD